LGLVFMFCKPGLIFSGTEGVLSRFQVLHSRTCFRWCRVRRVTFSCFADLDSFSVVPRSFHPVFLFTEVARTSFGFPRATGPESDGSRFHVLRVGTSFRRYRGRRDPFSCFACPDSFPAVPRASVPVFKFCAPRLIYGSTEGVRSPLHILRFQTSF
jgi:hypothetical protein